MTHEQYVTASKILYGMETQDFADFYGIENEDKDEVSPFTKYIEGHEDALSRDEILQKIVRLFNIPNHGFDEVVR